MRVPSPIVVVCDSDISLYGSAQIAERSLEPVDVLAGIVAVYDGCGRRLRVRVVPPSAGRLRPLVCGISTVGDGRVLIQNGDDVPEASADELRSSMLEYLRASGVDVPSNSQALEDLLRLAIDELGYDKA